MQLSLSYRITLFIIKLKGLKKSFSQDPVDYKKIRKEDLHHPKGNYFKKNAQRTFNVLNTQITEVKDDSSAKKLTLFVHGGAFISGPSQIHWDATKQITSNTDQAVWMIDYPKAPENDIIEIAKNMDAVYAKALKDYSSEEITLIGDSVGGTLITTLTQRLIQKSDPLPRKIILLCPVMEASMSNPDIERIDKIDPMLSKKGILSAKKMCAQKTDLSDPIISPLNGSFDNFPKTILFIAKNDIMYPDQLLAVDKLKLSKVDLTVIVGQNMPHIWPILPVMKEAKEALQKIIQLIKE